MTKKGNLQQGAFHLEKGKKLEWLMAVILLSAAYVLSRECARLVAAQKAATKVVVVQTVVEAEKLRIRQNRGKRCQRKGHQPCDCPSAEKEAGKAGNPCGDDAGRGG